MIGELEIISSGLYSSIQDKGRFGFSKYGVPKSGAMDMRALYLANAILNNNENTAVIEWTMIPPVLKFHGDTIICITGAECTPFLNDEIQKMNYQFRVNNGDVLKLKNIKKGVFGYVGIKFGFLSEFILDSRSQYNLITKSGFLKKGDVISYRSCADSLAKNVVIKTSFFLHENRSIEVYEGPEFDQLSDSQIKDLLDMKFTISNDRNRMAIPLNESLKNDLSSMLTSPVLPGTVQLTPSGQLIVLMRDCQTTGGYPRILQLTEDSINRIAQKRVGEHINFEIYSGVEIG
ncbi:5-oxoprolinase subunit C family protein [Aquimarina mycalae]|uniref:5-oxoprolinase subunit C family protein n=1 Tax=Aquimarina mycalae TaxID=3040073 RepID=UPI002477FC94|nr:biotin-dependent carboxyltransferase family protein [Aquimarina sp. 2201CG14-23]MDH7444119.1 biotin-dependent carboxyltransferase family protein [Aquimarina sp. 2201CG14-23]